MEREKRRRGQKGKLRDGDRRRKENYAKGEKRREKRARERRKGAMSDRSQ